MTKSEISKKYNIPINVLKEYEKWEFCEVQKKEYQYSDADLERLSMIMTLYDIGFENKEVKMYMKLFFEKEDTQSEIIHILNQKRNNILSEIHCKEQQIDKLDYIRHNIITKIKKD